MKNAFSKENNEIENLDSNEIENVLIDLYVDIDMPSSEEFFEKIKEQNSQETDIELKEKIQKICNAGEKAKKYIDNILDVLHDIRKVEPRKEQAAMIKRNYNENSSIVFSILDNKQITKQQWTKLIKQRL